MAIQENRGGISFIITARSYRIAIPAGLDREAITDLLNFARKNSAAIERSGGTSIIVAFDNTIDYWQKAVLRRFRKAGCVIEEITRYRYS
jgi:hypothetical protein